MPARTYNPSASGAAPCAAVAAHAAKILDLDYARYAAAKATLGWLTREGELSLETELTPAS